MKTNKLEMPRGWLSALRTAGVRAARWLGSTTEDAPLAISDVLSAWPLGAHDDDAAELLTRAGIEDHGPTRSVTDTSTLLSASTVAILEPRKGDHYPIVDQDARRIGVVGARRTRGMYRTIRDVQLWFIDRHGLAFWMDSWSETPTTVFSGTTAATVYDGTTRQALGFCSTRKGGQLLSMDRHVLTRVEKRGHLVALADDVHVAQLRFARRPAWPFRGNESGYESVSLAGFSPSADRSLRALTVALLMAIEIQKLEDSTIG